MLEMEPVRYDIYAKAYNEFTYACKCLRKY